jgi:hypothetical protein
MNWDAVHQVFRIGLQFLWNNGEASCINAKDGDESKWSRLRGHLQNHVIQAHHGLLQQLAKKEGVDSESFIAGRKRKADPDSLEAACAPEAAQEAAKIKAAAAADGVVVVDKEATPLEEFTSMVMETGDFCSGILNFLNNNMRAVDAETGGVLVVKQQPAYQFISMSVLRALKGQKKLSEFFALVDRIISSTVSQEWVKFGTLLAVELTAPPQVPTGMGESEECPKRKAYMKELQTYEEGLSEKSSGIFVSRREFEAFMNVRALYTLRLVIDLGTGAGRLVDFDCAPSAAWIEKHDPTLETIAGIDVLTHQWDAFWTDAVQNAGTSTWSTYIKTLELLHDPDAVLEEDEDDDDDDDDDDEDEGETDEEEEEEEDEEDEDDDSDGGNEATVAATEGKAEAKGAKAKAKAKGKAKAKPKAKAPKAKAKAAGAKASGDAKKRKAEDGEAAEGKESKTKGSAKKQKVLPGDSPKEGGSKKRGGAKRAREGETEEQMDARKKLKALAASAKEKKQTKSQEEKKNGKLMSHLYLRSVGQIFGKNGQVCNIRSEWIGKFMDELRAFLREIGTIGRFSNGLEVKDGFRGTIVPNGAPMPESGLGCLQSRVGADGAEPKVYFQKISGATEFRLVFYGEVSYMPSVNAIELCEFMGITFYLVQPTADDPLAAMAFRVPIATKAMLGKSRPTGFFEAGFEDPRKPLVCVGLLSSKRKG